jgi:hypothetical protein
LSDVRSRAPASSLGVHPSFRVLSARRLSRALVREATPPLAISSASWPSSVDTGWARLRTQTHPLFDFGSPSECYPTDPSRQ